MKIETSNCECGTLLSIEGRLDTAASEGLEKKLSELDISQGLCIDLGKVDYISSAFLRICIKCCKNLGDGKFCLRNPRPEVRKVFKISNLEKLIKSP
ncbi:MAG: STAS domain-containing protein [Victivallales bacterium]|nr:STAS domain-containing protein [Victivallales bacterium]